MNKKVLFITYYWPPSGKASLHWPLGIIKHLPAYNWEPYVLTVEEETFTKKDYSLLKEIPENLTVKKTDSFDVFTAYKRFLGKNPGEGLSVSETMTTEGAGWKQKLSMWVRMNLFVPDARIGWFPYAVKGGSDLIEAENKEFGAIISIGTPHSTHLIGNKLAKKYSIPHVPFFSDPWTTISYYNKFKRNFVTRSIDEYLEGKILRESSASIFVTKNTRDEFVRRYPGIKNKTNVLYWGYNEDQISEIENSAEIKPKDNKVIIHSGNLFDYQNPQYFWKTVKQKVNTGEKFKIKFTGTVGPAVLKSIKDAGLHTHCEELGFLPYNEMMNELLNADYLLMCPYDSRHVPGKLFEYLRTGKPVIAFCDDNSEVKNILEDANAGMMFPYDASGEEFFDNEKKFQRNIDKIRGYSRKNITGELSGILNKLSKTE